ncbi:NUDIX hydrolase [Flectobacillus roseus]|uniref:CoA pyrophosphatase n=1 Tax=Flectobacillus roseus TaxID=502259 RepID=A0ABT6Y3S4_9BACT|nr:CoA pyrophosphatase [Flectobacillus roseus]MDI9858205.1 CoA pyrophosphatase [Flectobacillus roseus]
MTDFNHFIDNLRQRFTLPLPGESAHIRMASSSRLKFKLGPNEKTRQSAVLILFYPHEGKIYLPLILRPAYDGVHGGQMAFPGGRKEREDENLIRTAMREAQEEIGVRLTDVKILGEISKLFIPPSNFYVQPVIGYMEKRPEFYPDPREVDQVVEVSLDELLDPAIIGKKILDVRGTEVEAAYFNIQGHTVWGATAMMIAEMIDLIQSS